MGRDDDGEDTPLSNSQLRILEEGIRALKPPLEEVQSMYLEVAQTKGELKLLQETVQRVITLLIDGNGVNPPMMQRITVLEQMEKQLLGNISALSGKIDSLDKSLRRIQAQIKESDILNQADQKRKDNRNNIILALALALMSAMISAILPALLDRDKVPTKPESPPLEKSVGSSR